MDDYLFDLYQGISGDIKSVREEIVALKKEQKITNAFLRLLVKKSIGEYYLPENPEQLVNKSFSLIYDSFSDVKLFVEMIASKTGNKVIIPEGDREGDLGAALSSATEGDYILINNDSIISSDRFGELLLQAFWHKKLYITLGAGPTAREVGLDIPNLRFVIYSDVEALLSLDIITAFPIVNKNK